MTLVDEDGREFYKFHEWNEDDTNLDVSKLCRDSDNIKK